MTLTMHAKNCILLSLCEGIGNLNPIPMLVNTLSNLFGRVYILKTYLSRHSSMETRASCVGMLLAIFFLLVWRITLMLLLTTDSWYTTNSEVLFTFSHILLPSLAKYNQV